MDVKLVFITRIYVAQTILIFLVLSSANKRSKIPNPKMLNQAMHNFLCKNIKLTRKVLTKDLLSKLVVIGVGTNKVEKEDEQAVCETRGKYEDR